jgi:guanylate kinase
MGKIIYLMGKSSTGKDTIFKRLLEDESLKLKVIVPYTTRPVRDGERNGVEYFFTDEAGFQKLKASGKVIEDRAYHTFHGLWRYFTVDDGQFSEDSQNCIMIGTLESYTCLKDYFGEDRLVPVMIELDDGIRLQRALSREQAQENPKYEEMCRRFLADSEDFADEKIKEAGIERRFENDDLERCMREIKEYIQQQAKEKG